MTIKSEITFPDDYTKSTFKTMSAEYDLQIKVEGCTVDYYEIVKSFTEISYLIGEPELVSTPYSFETSPACTYPATIEIIGLPDHAEHDEESSTFRIFQTDDVFLAGSYLVNIRSTIEVPDPDYAGETIPYIAEFSFDIMMIDPCKNTTIDDAFSIENLISSTSVGEERYFFN